MEALMEAIKSNDLVAVRKAVAPLLQERTSNLIEERKIELARSIMIEGEESDEDDEDDKDEDDKSDSKDKSDDDEDEDE